MFAKAVTADTALKLLAAAMINRGRARECLEGIMIFEFVGCILVIIFLVFLWKDFFVKKRRYFKQMNLIASNSKNKFSSNAQRGISISVYHGKYNEFNRVVCVRKKRVSSGAVGVSDGRLFEKMRAVVCFTRI